ncbi:MAG: polyprenyl synthetase family protein [Candidatus Dormibacteria bacterium]
MNRDFLLPIRDELAELETRFRTSIEADTGVFSNIMTHFFAAGGKRLRPALALLCCRLGDYDFEKAAAVAMAVEFIHSATLVHDDVIDRAPTRRGFPTVAATYGDNTAIIVGDYYFGKAAHLIGDVDDPRVLQILSSTVMRICHGEILQLTSRNEYLQTVEQYYAKIEHKTATLLSASCHAASVLSHRDADRIDALRSYGYNVGMAFQVVDDVLDYVSSAEEMGKPVGSDLRQGTVTLPLMYALEDAPSRSVLEPILARASLEESDFAQVVEVVRQSPGVERSYAAAQDWSRRAVADMTMFPESPYRQALVDIAEFVVARTQ